MATTQLQVNNRYYSEPEAEIACALKIWLRMSDETIGTILGARRNCVGGPPIHCAGLVASLQGSSHAVYHRVSNNRAYWEPEAQRVYQDWMVKVSQIVQRYGASYPSLIH